MYYVLDAEGQPVPEPDVLVWGFWFETAWPERRVAVDQVGALEVSTVFLGLDHQWGDGPPLLFETMVFGPDGLNTWRYSTRAEAEAGHAVACRWARRRQRHARDYAAEPPPTSPNPSDSLTMDARPAATPRRAEEDSTDDGPDD